MILAGLGAEVLKIERPGRGDEARQMAPSADGWSAYFLAINRGKRSISVDLSQPEGVMLALRLAVRCDVFVENFRGGKAEVMGFGEDAVRGVRADIVYASLSAFGPRGEDFDKPGYDALLQARTGILSVTGEPGTAGARAGVSILDMGAGMWIALGVMAALFERQRTGIGGRVDGSLYQTGVMWMAYHLVARQMTGRDPQPQGTSHGAFAPYGDFTTADSRVLIGISNDRLFERLCETVGLPPDERFATNHDRVKHRDALNAALTPLLKQRTTADWLDRFEQAGVPASAIQTAGQVLDDPQLAALAQMSNIPGMDLSSPVSSPVLPIEFSGLPAVAGAAPGLGEHSREILLESGFSPDEIDGLVQRRIVQCLVRRPVPPKSSG